MSGRFVPAQRDRATSEFCFSKVGFLVFIAMVTNCMLKGGVLSSQAIGMAQEQIWS